MTVETFSVPTTDKIIPYEIIPYDPVTDHFESLSYIRDREKGEDEKYIFSCFAEEYSELNILDHIGGLNNDIFERYREKVNCIGLEIEYDFRSEQEAFSLEKPLILASEAARLPVLCKPDYSLSSANGIEINTAPGTVEQVTFFLNILLKNWTVPKYAVHGKTGLHLNIDASWFLNSKSPLLMNWMANNEAINTYAEDYYGRKFASYGCPYIKNYKELLKLSSVKEALLDYYDLEKKWIYRSMFRYKGNRWEWRSFKAVQSLSEIEKIFKIFYIFLDLAHQQDLFVENKEETEQTIINHLSSSS